MEWQSTSGLTDYDTAVRRMEARVAAIRAGEADELVWLVEHPPLYTGGTSARRDDLLDAQRFPVYETGRGGEYTYHGPGQRVAYVMLDLERRGKDLRAYVHQLEGWIIDTLAVFGVKGEVREGRVGVWVRLSPTICRSVPDRSDGSMPFGSSWQPENAPFFPRTHDEGAQQRDPALSTPHRGGQQSVAGGNIKTEKKIAAIGIRVRKWVTYHGIALNVHPDLSHYGGIVPCGISRYGVTSLQDLGVKASMAEVDAVLKTTFEKRFERN